jgi:hypothetical protein
MFVTFFTRFPSPVKAIVRFCMHGIRVSKLPPRQLHLYPMKTKYQTKRLRNAIPSRSFDRIKNVIIQLNASETPRIKIISTEFP